ncbi:glycosyltransferase family 1 protein [Virgibacillus phasianinus]|uniref:Glycosyltransferase family 1 protein n=1 Tax=Virgibacillus phasianinus TaxID=2017483 RepID=A0A220U6F1_9BACI|nr:glycosyltransferase family 4 protein [Virgibacillus phasianinus]ASK63728.1 glycosyltransferase family 1 protein [Virgibacillus phasianinus]
MAKKILYCATVDYHFKAFHLPYMKGFKEQGWEVHVAAAGEMDLPFTDYKYEIPFQRSPYSLSNVAAYKELKDIMVRNNYDIIHCHTPIGGLIARLAARKPRKRGTKVIYTAHGFHFCKGAPLINWLLYYPIEKWMSHYTDCLITINQEDYQLASTRLKARHIEHVHGVGIDTNRFMPIAENKKVELKKSFGYKADDFLLFYAAEFNKNKNQEFLLRLLAAIKDSVPNAKLLFAGEGALLEGCREQAKSLGISHMVNFLGFRNDIQTIVPMCDIAVASSYREGLPVNIMEAMACGLPVVAVDNRGHRELVHNNENGWLVADNDLQFFSEKVIVLATTKALRESFGQNGRSMMLSTYSVHKVLQEINFIYAAYMKEGRELSWAIH